MSDGRNIYAILFREKFITRWSLMRNVTPDTLAAHSYEVSIITHALAMIGNKLFSRDYDCGRAVMLALYHDAPEVYTGDLPTPVKYFSPEMRASYAAIELSASEVMLGKLPTEFRDDFAPLLGLEQPESDIQLHALVKAADKLCAYIKCLEEEKCGNDEFHEAGKTILAALNDISLPEVKYFMNEFLPAFALTVDEL